MAQSSTASVLAPTVRPTRTSASHVRSLVQAMPNGVILLDARGYVREVNQEATRLLGEPLEGTVWRDVIDRAFQPRADDGHEVSLRSGRRVRLDISSLSPDPGQLIVLTDLSETRALLERISHLQRLTAMGRMVASLAHQIRTPLSAALLYADNLARPQLDGAQREKFANKITARLKDLEQQVNDMLLYAKSGEQQPVRTVLVKELFESLSTQLEAFSEQQKVAVELSCERDDLALLGNQSALSGAIQNLVVNGIQASSPGSAVTVTAQADEEWIEVIVTDSGSGISQTDLDDIFTPFFTRKVHGTGLGLAVVKTVINAHQGDIQVASVLEQGTTFTLRLPRADASRLSERKEESDES
ncbi:MAG: PAS domain-containing protein [Idiomarina sp.]|nr:PAS domain-containing protein [Idiomarina sp.]